MTVRFVILADYMIAVQQLKIQQNGPKQLKTDIKAKVVREKL